MHNIKNIWYVHPYAGGPNVGRFSRPYHLASEWKKLGVKATIFTPSFHHLLDVPQNSGIREVEGVTYEFISGRVYDGNSIGRLLSMAEFSAKLKWNASYYIHKHGRPDLIIGSSPHPYIFFSTHSIAKKLGVYSIFEVRDLWPLSLVELGGISSYHPLVRITSWVERYAYMNANYVVSLLPCTLSYMATRGLEKNNWRYIPNGIHPEEANIIEENNLHPSVEKTREWRSNGKIVVVYTGALGRPNHIESLIKAIAALRDQGNLNIFAIIVGRGEREEQLKILISELKLENRIALYEQISKKNVLQLLREANIGYISLRPEPIFRFGTSPNKLFDYMLASLPVLFAVQTAKDPVQEAACGISVNPDNIDAIANGLRQIAALTNFERQVMGRKGFSYVIKNHNYEILAKTYLALDKQDFSICS